MPNFVLKPGGVHYLLAADLVLPNGKPIAAKGKNGGRYRIEPGGVISAPSIAYFGGAKDRWESTTAKAQVIVNRDVNKIFDPESFQEEKSGTLLPTTKPSKPFLFPTDDGLYHVFKSPDNRITDSPVSLEDAKSILDAFLQEQDEPVNTDEKKKEKVPPSPPAKPRRGRPSQK